MSGSAFKRDIRGDERRVKKFNTGQGGCHHSKEIGWYFPFRHSPSYIAFICCRPLIEDNVYTHLLLRLAKLGTLFENRQLSSRVWLDFSWGGLSALYRYLLIARFALVNIVAFALFVAAYLQGWLDGLFADNLREMLAVIFLVFLYGLVHCGIMIWRYNVELNDVAAGEPSASSFAGKYLAQVEGVGSNSRSMLLGTLRLKLTNKIVVVRNVANALILLGLIGTVIGFIIALSGVDPKAAAQVENVAKMISTLISGMSVALYTTLIGSVLYVWLIVNYGILTSGTVNLIAAIVDLGEARGRS